MEAIQELYVQGKFERVSSSCNAFRVIIQAYHSYKFGLSNFSYERAIYCYNYATSESYVLPSVYEIAYSLVVRRPKADFLSYVNLDSQSTLIRRSQVAFSRERQRKSRMERDTGTIPKYFGKLSAICMQSLRIWLIWRSM
jgi:hypothetical protein